MQTKGTYCNFQGDRSVAHRNAMCYVEVCTNGCFKLPNQGTIIGKPTPLEDIGHESAEVVAISDVWPPYVKWACENRSRAIDREIALGSNLFHKRRIGLQPLTAQLHHFYQRLRGCLYNNFAVKWPAFEIAKSRFCTSTPVDVQDRLEASLGQQCFKLRNVV